MIESHEGCSVFKSACGLVKKQFPRLSESRIRSIAVKIDRWASEPGAADFLTRPDMADQVSRLPSKLAALVGMCPQLFAGGR